MVKSYRPFEISVRCDGYVNVWAYMPWPDEELDKDPERREWLISTLGWQAMGWQVVHVSESRSAARAWASRCIF